MIFPGIKKLGNAYGFANNRKVCYGILKNTYIIFGDGANQKHVWFRFPVQPDNDDKLKIETWKKSGYAKRVVFLEEDYFHVRLDFVEYVTPFKVEKMKTVIDDIAEYFYNKYPQAKITCREDNTSTDIEFYDMKGVPFPLCADCAKSLEAKLDSFYEEEKLQDNNYIRGTLAAFVCALPGILVSILLFTVGLIAGIAGFCYYYLARKGFVWAKGKYNAFGIVIVSIISFFYSAFGTAAGYIVFVIRTIRKEMENQIALTEAFELSLQIIQEAELKKELLTNIYLTLFICAIAVLPTAFQNFKEAKRIKIKKL